MKAGLSFQTPVETAPPVNETWQNKYCPKIFRNPYLQKARRLFFFLLFVIVTAICFTVGPIEIFRHGEDFLLFFPNGENCTDLEEYSFIYDQFISNQDNTFENDAIAVYITAYVTVTNTIKDTVFSFLLGGSLAAANKYLSADVFFEIFQLVLFSVLMVFYFVYPNFSIMVIANGVVFCILAASTCIISEHKIKWINKINSLGSRKLQFAVFYLWSLYTCMNFQVDDVSLLCIYLTYIFCYGQMVTLVILKSLKRGVRKIDSSIESATIETESQSIVAKTDQGEELVYPTFTPEGKWYYFDAGLYCCMSIVLMIVMLEGTSVDPTIPSACPKHSYFVWVLIIIGVTIILNVITIAHACCCGGRSSNTVIVKSE